MDGRGLEPRTRVDRHAAELNSPDSDTRPLQVY